MRLLSLFVCFLYAVSTYAVAPPPCPSNLLTNGSFESSSTSWTVSGVGVSIVAEPKDALSALRICPTSGLTRVYQTIHATAGTNYSFTTWAQYNSGEVSQMFIKCMDANWSPLETKFLKLSPSSTGGAYEQFSLTITAPAGTVRMEVGFFTQAGCAVIDDACVTTGTTPLSCTLTGTATEIVCNDNNTPNITTDDTWRCKLTVVVNGTNCQINNTWYGSGSGPNPGTLVGNYGTPSLSVPFLISEGNQIITFVAANNPNVKGTLVVMPPAVCSTPPSTVCTNNLASNGGFEFNLNDWTANGATIANSGATGTKSIQVCQGQSLRQMKLTSSSQTLTLTYQAKSVAAGAKVLSYIKYLDGNWNVLATEFFTATPSATAFSQFTVTRAAMAGAVYVEFGFLNTNPGCVLIDNVCLSNNPCSNDVIAPVMSPCPANITVQSTNGTNATATWVAPTATDNCPGAVTVTASATSGQAFAVGATTITYTARDAAQNSTVCAFAVTVQGVQTGTCGFLRTVATTKPMPQSGALGIDLSSAGFKLSKLSDFSADSLRISSLNISPTGVLGNQTHVEIKRPEMVNIIATDGQLVSAYHIDTTQIVLRKQTTNGVLTFEKTFAVPNLMTNYYNPYMPTTMFVNSIIERNDGGFLIDVSHKKHFYVSTHLIETDANGNLLRLINRDIMDISYANIGYIQIANGAIYGVNRNSYFSSVGKVDTNYQPIWSHTYREKFGFNHLEESSDGLYVYIFENTTQQRVTKRLKQTGTLIWEKSIQDILGSINNNFTTTIGTVSASPDGGIVMSILNTGSVQHFVKMNGLGVLEWSKLVSGAQIISKIKPISNGYLLGGFSATDWLAIKTDLTGNWLPDCETGVNILPDLTIENISFTASSVAPGTSFQVKYDVRNLKAVASGNYKVKFYISPNPAISLNYRQLNVISQVSIPANGQALQQVATLDIPLMTPLESHYIVADVDSENNIAEDNEDNNRTNSANTILITDAPAGGSDLELSITSDKTTVPQWSPVTLSIKAKNNSATSIINATVELGLCGNAGKFEFTNANKIVYGTPPVAPTGSTYNQVAQVWNTGTIAAGQTVTLTVPLFTLGAQTYRVMAWTTAQSPADPDSQASVSPLKLTTGGTCAVAQDDEAEISFGPTLLQSSNPNTAFEPLPMADRAFLYPNPVQDVLTINLDDYLDQTNVTLIVQDAQGQVRHTETIDRVFSSLRQISVHDLSSGWYIVRVQQAGVRERVGRVVVVRE